MRDCITCGTLKSLDAFGKNSRYADKIHRSCKQCEAERRRRWYHAHTELELQRARQYREKYPERRAATARKHRYGITADEFDRRHAAQDGKCLVCAERRVLTVDHDHKTGRIRGLLCGNCNRALGIMQEIPERIAALAEYATQCAVGGDVRDDHSIWQPQPPGP